MSKKSVLYLMILLVCVLMPQNIIYSQETPRTPSATPAKETVKENQTSAEPENLIHHGDLIDVDIIGSTEYDWRGRINPEGFLEGLDFIEEPVNALCRSEESIAADIAKGYSKLLREPQVKVKIVDKSGRPNSFLYGAVRTPQRFLLQREANLNELIILAGGITDKTSGEIQVVRPSSLSCNSIKKTDAEIQSQKISTTANEKNETKIFNIKIADLLKGEKDSNPVIVNGDIITVLEAVPIYVTGGVLNPKPINVTSKMTVSRAVSSAGGLIKGANPKEVTIFRRGTDGTKTIQVNLDEIKAGTAEDFVLQKFDIVEVSLNGSDKRKLPPVIINEAAEKKSSQLPLRIIQ